jgi:hypothetical protein
VNISQGIVSVKCKLFSLFWKSLAVSMTIKFRLQQGCMAAANYQKSGLSHWMHNFMNVFGNTFFPSL